MGHMFVAELAKFLQLHAVGIGTLVLVRRVISLLAARASQRDDNPHVTHLLNPRLKLERLCLYKPHN